MEQGIARSCRRLNQQCKASFKATLAWLIEPGDCVSFLKRSYELLDEETMVMRPHSKHVERLVSMLHLESKTC